MYEEVGRAQKKYEFESMSNFRFLRAPPTPQVHPSLTEASQIMNHFFNNTESDTNKWKTKYISLIKYHFFPYVSQKLWNIFDWSLEDQMMLTASIIIYNTISVTRSN